MRRSCRRSRKSARVNHAARYAKCRRVNHSVRRLENNRVAVAGEHVRRQRCAALQARNRQLFATRFILPLISRTNFGIARRRAAQCDFVAVERERNISNQRIFKLQRVARIIDGNFFVRGSQCAARNFNRLVADYDVVAELRAGA